MKRAEIIASLPPESEYSGEALVVRRLYVDDGMSCREIGKRRGYSYGKARDLLNPAYREQHRASARKWKRDNRERKRAYDRAYAESKSGTCSDCHGSMGVGVANGICRSCRVAQRDRTDDRVVELWNQGYSLAHIAADVGSTPNAIAGPRLNRLRREGRVGYRYPGNAGRFAA